MKAVLCHKFTDPDGLVLEETAPPAMTPGGVRIAIHACGVNFPDTLIIQGKYQFKPDFPFSPGGEIAGEVVEVAPDVKDLKPGDRVAAMSTWGGFAEEIVVPAGSAVKIPDVMDFPTASGFLITYATTYHGLVDRARLQPGETLLVLGAAGGVGMAAVQLGKALGARVIAAASSAEKLRFAAEQGADDGINYATEDLKERVRELTGGKGADVIYDAVGGKATETVMSAINWKGRLLVVGFASGEIPKIALNRVLLKGCDIVGVFWGAFDKREAEKSQANNRALMDLFVKGAIRPVVSTTYRLADAGKALRDIEERRAKGKIVLVTDRERR